MSGIKSNHYGSPDNLKKNGENLNDLFPSEKMEILKRKMLLKTIISILLTNIITYLYVSLANTPAPLIKSKFKRADHVELMITLRTMIPVDTEDELQVALVNPTQSEVITKAYIIESPKSESYSTRSGAAQKYKVLIPKDKSALVLNKEYKFLWAMPPSYRISKKNETNKKVSKRNHYELSF